MVDFSFIIPVYNAEKTIERCLDSIKAQIYHNFEVIIIDDGSSDDSYAKCKQYQNKDKRFRVCRQENLGPSAARNKGIECAKGTWICFVDSDDTVSEYYLKRLYQKIQAEDPEVIFMGYTLTNTVKKITEVKLPGFTGENYYEALVDLSFKDMFGYTWIKCFKRELIGNKRFDESLKLFEDEVFTCDVLENCHKISVLNESVYCYYISESDTLMKKTYQDYCQKCDRVFRAWQKLMCESGFTSQFFLKKAEIFVERCKYYSWEKNVKLKEFYSDLAKTNFFGLVSHSERFNKYVAEKRYRILQLEKIIYNFKGRLKYIKNCVGKRQ